MMAIPARAAIYVKHCLFVMLAGLLALSLSACSQSSEPEEEVQPEALPLEEVVAEVQKPEKKTTRSRRSKSARRAQKKVKPAAVEMLPAVESQAAPAAPETVAPESTSAPAATALSYPKVQMPVPFVPSAPGKRIAQVSVPGPYVAVTFDDGPSASLTPQVLDIFNRHGARATFFVLGRNANSNRSLLARAVAEGHEVGAHTWSHINMRTSSTSKIIDELDRTNAVIEKATGRAPKVMRPPYGSVNSKLVNMVYNRYGTPAILWDVDTNDWRKPGVEKVVRRAVGKARPGSIILLHDIHPSTIAAVEDIVTGLQARGFKLVTVSELIALGRNAAGASAPVRTPEAAAPAEAPTAPADMPAAAPADMPAPAAGAPLHAQQQQPLPEGAAAIGVLPAAPVVPAAPAAPAEATPAQPEPLTENPDFDFYES